MPFNIKKKETREFGTSARSKKNPRGYNTISEEISKKQPTKNKPQQKKKNKEKSKIKEKSILRIDRILSNRGLGSRSELHDLVKKRRVVTFQDKKTGQLIRILGPTVSKKFVEFKLRIIGVMKTYPKLKT